MICISLDQNSFKRRLNYLQKHNPVTCCTICAFPALKASSFAPCTSIIIDDHHDHVHLRQEQQHIHYNKLMHKVCMLADIPL